MEQRLIIYAFFSHKILVIVGKAQVLLITLIMALYISAVPVSHDSVTVSRHAKYQDPETGWNSANIKLTFYTFAFPTVTCQSCLQ